MTAQDHATLDLFAGSGVGVAHQHLGIPEHGVEIMPEAIATREMHGMHTPYNDVWEVEKAANLIFNSLWGSPPCQAFSAAGKGAGRKALDDVLAAIASGAWRRIDELRDFATSLGDERIGLVLTPLHYAFAFRPTYIALEQVPPVLPVWEAMAEVLRSFGYSVWTGFLHAEQYGVPQTRKRAFLLARRDGIIALPPVPTHSRYYPLKPEKLDPGVAKWVSMAEALAWGLTERPSYTLTTGGTATGGGFEPFGNGAKQGMRKAAERGEFAFAGAGLTAAQTSGQRPRPLDEPAHTITGAGNGVFLRSNYGTSGDKDARGERELDAPAPTLTSKAGRNKWLRSNQRVNGGPYASRDQDEPAVTITGLARSMQIVEEGDVTGRNMAVAEAAALQTYPAHVLRPEIQAWEHRDHPATTVAGDPRLPKRGHHDRQMNGALKMTTEEAATLQTYPHPFEALKVMGSGMVERHGARPGRSQDEPAFTIRASAGGMEPGGFVLRDVESRVTRRLAPAEVADFQAYPRPFEFAGTKTKQFLQIGNAVPPLLAMHVLEAVWAQPAATVIPLHRTEIATNRKAAA